KVHCNAIRCGICFVASDYCQRAEKRSFLTGNPRQMSKLNRPLRLGKWRPSIPCLEAHMEAGSLRVSDRIYVIGGYQTLTRMCARMQILDIERGTWSYGPALPGGVALSHGGLASEG